MTLWQGAQLTTNNNYSRILSDVHKEHDDEKPLPDAKGMLAALLDDNAEVIRQIRSDLETMEKEGSKDFGTSNFLEDMIEKKEKVTWMIRAHLE